MKIVERGAAFLDEHEPGWDKKIDPATLDLGSSCNCVLGQLYRADHPRTRHPSIAFDRKVEELGIPWSKVGRFGFAAFGNTRYPNLTAAWQRLILRRRAAS